ncbi:MAG: ribonuclease HI [Chloroflexi bacterium]|nr:ribonuclease HI [Chloroflexota bacterium]
MAEEALPTVEIYTDGGCDPNPGPGGWGAVLVSGLHTKEISGAELDTTNNRMELTAAIEALRELKRPCAVILYTDSQYLRRGITDWLPQWQANNWRRANGQPVENQDLWQELVAQEARHRVEWRWLRGHQGHPLNERADELATRARQQLLRRETKRPVNGAVRTWPKDMPTIDIYTRGCVLGMAGGPGGYAAVLVRDGAMIDQVAGAWPSATSNLMELWAAVAGLRALAGPAHVTIYTVSKYLYDGATRWLPQWERNNWLTASGQPLKNREIWQELVYVMGDHDVRWEFLPVHKRGGHSAEAAKAARREAMRLVT